MKKKEINQIHMMNHFLLKNINDNNNLMSFFRGEKLYVTKDKRLKSNNWRKRILWIIGLALCAAVIIVAILLASEFSKKHFYRAKIHNNMFCNLKLNYFSWNDW